MKKIMLILLSVIMFVTLTSCEESIPSKDTLGVYLKYNQQIQEIKYTLEALEDEYDNGPWTNWSNDNFKYENKNMDKTKAGSSTITFKDGVEYIFEIQVSYNYVPNDVKITDFSYVVTRAEDDYMTKVLEVSFVFCKKSYTYKSIVEGTADDKGEIIVPFKSYFINGEQYTKIR